MFQNKNLNNKLVRTNTMNNKNLNKKANNNLFTKEYEINDVRISVRNILTKGQTHEEISHYSGASISTRGRYIAPNEKSRGAIHDRPLYLFIQGNSKNDVDLAIQKIEEIIQRESINSQNSNNQKFSKFQSNRNPPVNNNNNNMQPSGGGGGNDSLLIEKIMVGLDHAPESFDLKGRVIGVGGANLHYIRNETGAMATLRGNNSGFIESHLGGYESNEPMHLYIEHTHFNGLQAAKQLAKNLIETIQQELIHFQQLNPPIPSNVQITTQPTIVHSEIFQSQQHQQQLNISQSLLAVPPPIVQHNGIIQQPPPQTIIQPQNILQPNPPQTLLPIQIHHQPPGNNMIIQQPGEQQLNPIGNLNIPPPGIHMPMKTGQLVQIQGATSHLSHPPPNIQIQPQPQQQPTQILLNQAPPNYQFQYVQQAQQQNSVDQQTQQVTIQHIYQTPQQIHGIVQQTQALPPQFDQIQVRGQQIQATQQYITLPGNTTAFMMPPPNIIQSHQPRPIQNVIYSSQPHQIHYSVPSEINVNQNMITTTTALVPSTTNSNEFSIKDDKNKIDIVNNANKNDNFSPNKKPPIKNQPPQQPSGVQTPISLSFTQMPPPIPPSTIQHIVEQQQQQQLNQTMCHQVPVSMAQPHQIQITTANVPTSNFIINGPQWTAAPQHQPPQHPQNTNQIIHVAPQQAPPPPQHHPQFRNPQDGGQNFYGDAYPPNQQMQIQFHSQTSVPPPPPPPPTLQHINIEQQQFGPQLPPPSQQQGPPRFHLQQQHPLHQQQQQSRMLHQLETGPPQQPQHMLMSQQGNNGNQIIDSFKINRKRKSENDGDPLPSTVPKIGMGLLINERDNQRIGDTDPPPPPIIGPLTNTTTNTTITTSRKTTTTVLSDDPNHDTRPGFGGTNNRDIGQNPQLGNPSERESSFGQKSPMYNDKFYEGRPIHVPGGQSQGPPPPHLHPQHNNSMNSKNNGNNNYNNPSNNNNNNSNNNNHKDINFKRIFNNNHNGNNINGPPFRMGGPPQMHHHPPGYHNQIPPHMDENRRYNIETLPPSMYNHPHRGNGNNSAMVGVPPGNMIGGDPRYRGGQW